MTGTALNELEILEMKSLSKTIWKGRSAQVQKLSPDEMKTPAYKRYYDLIVRYFNNNQK
jgi:hypothetical protein